MQLTAQKELISASRMVINSLNSVDHVRGHICSVFWLEFHGVISHIHVLSLKVEAIDDSVHGATDDVLAVITEVTAHNHSPAILVLNDWLFCIPQVPNVDESVATDGDSHSSFSVRHCIVNSASMVSQLCSAFTARGIPNAAGSIRGSREELLAILEVVETPNSIGMAF